MIYVIIFFISSLFIFLIKFDLYFSLWEFLDLLMEYLKLVKLKDIIFHS
jgi:hypothetical protein